MKRDRGKSPVMVGAVLLIGGMWGYPGGPIREEMFCLESMYMFPVGEETKGQDQHPDSHACVRVFAEHELLSSACTSFTGISC